MIKRLFIDLVTLVFWLAAAMPAVAQNYPNRPVRLVVPFATGGATDVLARQAARPLSENLRQPVIVDNRPGAGGRIGFGVVRESPPDGYTLLWGASGAFDPRELRPVAEVCSFPYVLAVSALLPASTVRELITHAKANPGKLAFAAVPGTAATLMGLIFKNLVGINISFSSYRAESEAINDLVAGRTQMLFSTVPAIFPQIASGKVRVLAVTSDHRLDEPWGMREVPTLKQSGLDKFALGAWSGVLAPMNTPDNIVEKINSALNQVLASNEFNSRVLQAGGLASRGSAGDFYRSIQQQAQLWKELISVCPDCTDVNCTYPKKQCSYDSSACCNPN